MRLKSVFVCLSVYSVSFYYLFSLFLLSSLPQFSPLFVYLFVCFFLSFFLTKKAIFATFKQVEDRLQA